MYYCFCGKTHELESIVLVGQCFIAGMRVADIGEHIGYITQYFDTSWFQGLLTVFEPRDNHLLCLVKIQLVSITSTWFWRDIRQSEHASFL